jgi:hypothetical protein
MATRIFKFYGQAFSPTGDAAINVTFNGVNIHSGSVPTINSSSPQQATDTTRELFQTVKLFEYTGSTDLVGNIPFELHVTSGTVFFGTIEANYSGYEIDDVTETVTTPPENYWFDVNNNSAETDGKSNVTINGVPQVRDPVDPTEIGDWWYQIFENDTFACNIFIDPEMIVLEIPE